VSRSNSFQAVVKSAALCPLFDFSTVGGSAEEKYPDCRLRDTPPAATHLVIPACGQCSALDSMAQQKSPSFPKLRGPMSSRRSDQQRKPGASRAFRSVL